MKKLATILGILAFVSMPVYATEETAQQETDIDMSGVVFVINKQPECTPIKQTVKIRRSGLVAIININGKVEIPTKTNVEKN